MGRLSEILSDSELEGSLSKTVNSTPSNSKRTSRGTTLESEDAPIATSLRKRKARSSAANLSLKKLKPASADSEGSFTQSSESEFELNEATPSLSGEEGEAAINFADIERAALQPKPVVEISPYKKSRSKANNTKLQSSVIFGAEQADSDLSDSEAAQPLKSRANPKGKGKAIKSMLKAVVAKKSAAYKGKGKGKIKEESEVSDLSALESDASDSGSGLDTKEEEDGDVKPAKLTTKGKEIRAKKPKAKLSEQERRARRRMSHFERNHFDLIKNHPELEDAWGDLEANIEILTPEKAPQPAGISRNLLPFQLEGLCWMKKQEAGLWRGGMLADEMGMGKTIQTISLICSDHDAAAKGKNKKMTLVVAPTVAIVQWRNEFSKFTNGFKVDVWHGQSRATDLKKLQEFDVVLTSYAVMESVYRRQEKGFQKNKELHKEESVLHKIKWHRIILDEAHNIKDRACNTAKAAFALKAKYRWCLSGTPLQNRVGELYSLIRFLGVLPFAANYCKKCDCRSLFWAFSNKKHCDQCGHTPMQHVWFWNNEILKPIQKFGSMGPGQKAFKKLSILLDRMMLRRTKVERADDLGLPPRVVTVRRDFFTEEEEELYTSLYSDVARRFNTYLDAGTVLNNYANVFTLITRMRQMACHPDLVLKSKTSKTIGMVLTGQEEEFSIQTCRICLDEAEDAIMSGCRHLFCRECIRQVVEGCGEDNAPECPVCHAKLVINLEAPAEEFAVDGTKSVARQGMLDRIDPSKWRTSTKIEALVEELHGIRNEDHTSKALVFSQSTSFLDLIARRLQLAGFQLARLQGTMTPEQRDRTIRYFSENENVTVFLLSLKAGGVALNLIEANYVYLVDPWWNPSVEYQAMDRIHRIGQRRPVICKRLIIENSIESRILELQKKKEHMIGACFGDTEAMGRLSTTDMQFLFSL